MSAVAASSEAVVAGGFVHDEGNDSDGEIWKRDGETWNRVCQRRCGEPQGGRSHQEVAGLAAIDGDFVAVGWDVMDAAVWTSPDGATWTRTAPDDDLRGSQGGVKVMRGVTRMGDRLVAVGRQGAAGAVWWSGDRGRTWTISRDVPRDSGGRYVELGAVAASGDSKLVAVGRAYRPGGKDRAVAWFSTDRGASWQTAEVADARDRGQKMAAVVSTPSGWIAVGQDRPEGPVAAAVWRSRNGATWTDASDDALGGDRSGSMAAIATLGDERILAVGAGTWTSE